MVAIQFIKGLFGGGSWGIYLVLAAVIGAFMLERGHMKGRIVELKSEVATAEAAKDSAIAGQLSLAASQGRRDKKDADSKQEEDTINALPKTYDCAQSEPVRAVIDRMWDEQRNDP